MKTELTIEEVESLANATADRMSRLELAYKDDSKGGWQKPSVEREYNKLAKRLAEFDEFLDHLS